ncbi:nicotinate-nucleotide--dimethylbenzimidazole phosphoribosyltransferase [Pseudonocardia sp. MH-G8]|uniref:nicotinate-nucleotide--dimethylbenzimidazole phosphoribosyltransferase n=1 Tax=Pseudonocardia sp. MH-G8 TaxID=1854588 RepID=UPI000BA00169|nr:nicotinate-nucleotide--dimethylbenzimidazole phosphoribosyltransferase [Pseudonocardia sp. MH-G8]OZM79859.1 nicotinate-nucleotide--dimethylbenzimidazole phosphoribosyltransferase [Pseudonocardia sp. MH-G8]
MELPPVIAPDVDAHRAAVARHAELAVPDGALGRLAELGVWLAAAQGACPPRPPARARVVVVAGDHGIAAAGVSADPPGATARQVAAVRDHTAPVGVVAPVAGVSVRAVDLALDTPPDGTERHRVRRGTGRIDREDALTADEVERAVAVGRALADEEVDSGADLLLPASLGVGATTPAATLVATLTGAEPVAVIGRGSGIDDAGWMRKAAAVRDALRRARPHARDPLALLRVAGGADIAALTGFCLQAALRRTPVLLDGLVVGAAALLADELAAGAREWWLGAQKSPDPAMALVEEHLHLSPVLDLGIRLGDGTGAVAAVPLLQMAARLLAETATAVPTATTSPAATSQAAIPQATEPGPA